MARWSPGAIARSLTTKPRSRSLQHARRVARAASQTNAQPQGVVFSMLAQTPYSGHVRRHGSETRSRLWGHLLFGARGAFIATLLAIASPAASLAAEQQNVLGTLPSVVRPPALGTAMSATVMPLAAFGYLEEEYFLQGQANRYRIQDPMHDAQLIDSGNPYVTRVLVRRPKDPVRFNGTVVVEWLNVSLDQDIDFVFGATRELLVRDGYAWIGVSAQRNGVAALKQWNPERYKALTVTASNVDPVDGREIDPADPLVMAIGGDVLAWDIFSEVAQLVIAQPDSLLGGLRAKRVIGAAESQSTLKVSTYYNTIQPLHRVYDGFLFYDRSSTLRADVGTKSITVGTEIFTALLGYPPQNDTDHQRWWELNGASHFSLDEMQSYIDPLIARDAAFRTPQGKAQSITDLTLAKGPCQTTSLYSRVPNGDVLKAALKSLNSWIAGGPAPATAPRFVVDDQNPPQYVRDAKGEILGGIRTAARDAAMSINVGIGQGPGFCGPSGSHADFTPAELCQTYGSHDAFVRRVRAVVNANIRDGVLLPEEAARTVSEALALAFSCPK